jgi:small subunit ribosomal protein S5
MKQELISWEDKELEDKVVHVRRVAKVVKGGRRFRFSALVVTGDKNGHVGWGLGKALEVPEAIKKAVDQAKKNLVKINMSGGTIPHEVLGKYGSAKVLIIPASDGTGIIAGNAARAVLEAAGIKNVFCKRYGTSNAIGVVKSAIAGLSSLNTVEEVAAKRGKTVEEIMA